MSIGLLGDRVPPALSDELVAANRILAAQGILDGFGHVSARVSPEADRFALSWSVAASEVTSDDLVLHDLDGNVDDGRRLYLERHIHGGIYRTRRDVLAVVHSHAPSVIPFTVVKRALRPLTHMAGFLGASDPPIFEIRDYAGEGTNLMITTPALGADLAGCLGEGAVVLMRGHGFVAVGGSIPEAVYRAIYTQANARSQIEAMALGEPCFLTGAEASAADGTLRVQLGRAWDAWRKNAYPAARAKRVTAERARNGDGS